ncbi:probable 6-phosphogluconolactonase 1 [Tripterygium wilfordii]|nr:probable 6-phosphogluconolactonase 1 [Tripterygium wilfordii]
MARGSFSLVLSGDIPKRLRKLTTPAYMKMLEHNWSKWHVFWAEENVVANNRHPDSLYRQANEAFISKVPVLPEHVVRVLQGTPGEEAANRYEFSIRQQVRNRTVAASPSNDCPRFDLIILTPESAGHLNHPMLEEEESSSQWVAYVKSPNERVVLTIPVINSAANVVIVADYSSLQAMRGRNPPAQMVKPKDGKLVWFVDKGVDSL